MVKLLKDKFGIEVSEIIIRRELQEYKYHYIGPKIYTDKNTWKEQHKKIRLV